MHGPVRSCREERRSQMSSLFVRLAVKTWQRARQERATRRSISTRNPFYSTPILNQPRRHALHFSTAAWLNINKMTAILLGCLASNPLPCLHKSLCEIPLELTRYKFSAWYAQHISILVGQKTTGKKECQQKTKCVYEGL